MPKVFAQYLDKSKYMSTPVGLSVEKNPRLGILVASPLQATVAMKQTKQGNLSRPLKHRPPLNTQKDQSIKSMHQTS